MRTVDFSALKVGDIILSDTPKFGSRVGELAYRYEKFVVVSVDSGNHAVVLSTNNFPVFNLLTRTESGFAMQDLDGSVSGAKAYNNLSHFTAEEFESLDMDNRIYAQRRLFALMDRLNFGGVPESVYREMQEIALGEEGERVMDSSLVDLPRARKVMDEAVLAGVRDYNRMTNAYEGVAKSLARQMRTAITESLTLLGRTEGWRNDGVEVVVENGCFENNKFEALLRTNVGVECLGEFYFVERVADGRAYVSDPATGEEVGYMGMGEWSSLAMYFNDGSKFQMPRYSIAPVSTREELAVYVEGFRAVRNYIVSVVESIREGLSAFDEVGSVHVGQVPKSVSGVVGYAYDMVGQLERSAHEVKERANEYVTKLLRFNKLAHGE